MQRAGAERGEDAIIERLRAGDERAFAALVDAHGPAMVRLAERFVGSHAIAEEVAQEAWVGFLRGLDRFEGRSSLRTFLLRIVVNLARTRGAREARIRPFSSFGDDDHPDGPTVDPSRFLKAGPDAGHWASDVRPWSRSPAEIVAEETLVAAIHDAIAALPANQRAVIELRDLAGLDGDEVCAVLGLSAGNQRVLLHRARAAVRHALEDQQP